MRLLRNYGVTLRTPDGRILSGARRTLSADMAALMLCLQNHCDPETVVRVNTRVSNTQRPYQAQLL